MHLHWSTNTIIHWPIEPLFDATFESLQFLFHLFVLGTLLHEAFLTGLHLQRQLSSVFLVQLWRTLDKICDFLILALLQLSLHLIVIFIRTFIDFSAYIFYLLILRIDTAHVLLKQGFALRSGLFLFLLKFFPLLLLLALSFFEHRLSFAVKVVLLFEHALKLVLLLNNVFNWNLAHAVFSWRNKLLGIAWGGHVVLPLDARRCICSARDVIRREARHKGRFGWPSLLHQICRRRYQSLVAIFAWVSEIVDDW